MNIDQSRDSIYSFLARGACNRLVETLGIVCGEKKEDASGSLSKFWQFYQDEKEMAALKGRVFTLISAPVQHSIFDDDARRSLNLIGGRIHDAVNALAGGVKLSRRDPVSGKTIVLSLHSALVEAIELIMDQAVVLAFYTALYNYLQECSLETFERRLPVADGVMNYMFSLIPENQRDVLQIEQDILPFQRQWSLTTPPEILRRRHERERRSRARAQQRRKARASKPPARKAPTSKRR